MGALVTYVVVPYFKSKTTAQQRDTIEYWVDVAVEAFEQKMVGTKLGEERKAEVLKFIQSKGFKIDEKDLDLLIEAAVKVMNDSKNEALKE
jgi:3-hydroxyacyl-CoA dehydrogenase